MLEHIQIRPATVDDAGDYLSLWETLDSETEFMLYERGERKMSLQQQTERLREVVNSSDIHMLSVLDTSESKLIGFAGAQRFKNRREYHKASIVLGIRATHWQRGIGGALLQQLETWSEEQNIHRLQLTVSKANLRAIKLYCKYGYRLEGIQKDAIRLRTGYHDQYLMAKLLN